MRPIVSLVGIVLVVRLLVVALVLPVVAVFLCVLVLLTSRPTLLPAAALVFVPLVVLHLFLVAVGLLFVPLLWRTSGGVGGCALPSPASRCVSAAGFRQAPLLLRLGHGTLRSTRSHQPAVANIYMNRFLKCTGV
jgi:hypothetical protein